MIIQPRDAAGRFGETAKTEPVVGLEAGTEEARYAAGQTAQYEAVRNPQATQDERFAAARQAVENALDFYTDYSDEDRDGVREQIKDAQKLHRAIANIGELATDDARADFGGLLTEDLLDAHNGEQEAYWSELYHSGKLGSRSRQSDDDLRGAYEVNDPKHPDYLDYLDRLSA